jgi:membrane protease YdiL (CAAX protease family)
LIVSVAAVGTCMAWHEASPEAIANPSRLQAVYVPSILVDWGLVLYVCRLGRGRSFLVPIVGALPLRARALFVDAALALGAWWLIELTELFFAHLLGHGHRAVGAMLPRTPLERAVWGAFALSAGFCEEVVYRGYLQTEIGARTTRLKGVLLQAVLFGVAHAEQGAWGAVRIGLYGLWLGLLAEERRSLVPGILCHVGIDVASGLSAG